MKKALSVLMAAALVVCFAFALVACNPQEKQEYYTPTNDEINTLTTGLATAFPNTYYKVVTDAKVSDGSGSFVTTHKEVSLAQSDSSTIIYWDETVTQPDGSSIRELRVSGKNAYRIAKFADGSDTAFYCNSFNDTTINNSGTDYLPSGEKISSTETIVRASNHDQVLRMVSSLNLADEISGVRIKKGNEIIRRQITIEFNNNGQYTAIINVTGDRITSITVNYENGNQYVAEYTYDIDAFTVPSTNEWKELYPVAG